MTELLYWALAATTIMGAVALGWKFVVWVLTQITTHAAVGNRRGALVLARKAIEQVDAMTTGEPPNWKSR